MATQSNPPARQHVDPDDAPPLSAEFFARADVFQGETLVRRGRPPTAEVRKATASQGRVRSAQELPPAPIGAEQSQAWLQDSRGDFDDSV